MDDAAPTSSDITVFGYSPRFRAAVDKLLEIEGGFVDDPADRGGATKYGISLRFLASEGVFDDDADGRVDFDLDVDGDIDGADVRRLTRGDAIALYHWCFWQRLQAERLPAPIGEMVFDQAVNAGLTTARKLLQRAINTCLMEAQTLGAGPLGLLKVDGQVGPRTTTQLQFVLGWPGLDLPEAYRNAVRERYRRIAQRFPSQHRFLRGWLARAERLGR